MEEKLTVREACRRRIPLDGADAQALEHGMTQLEAENAKLRRMYDAAMENAALWKKDVEGRDLQVKDLHEALLNMVGFFGEAATRHSMGKTFSPTHAEVVKGAKQALAKYAAVTERPVSELGLDLKTYEAAKAEQARGEKVLLDDVIKNLGKPKEESKPMDEALIDNIVRAVAELPDRSSPDDQPNMMLVTDAELREILQAHLREKAKSETEESK
jgi:hypothetical protein